MTGDDARAIEALRRTLEITPSHSGSHALLSSALQEQGDLDEAQRHLELAQALRRIEEEIAQESR